MKFIVEQKVVKKIKIKHREMLRVWRVLIKDFVDFPRRKQRNDSLNIKDAERTENRFTALKHLASWYTKVKKIFGFGTTGK